MSTGEREDQEVRCPFTLLLTGGNTSSLEYDGEGSSVLGANTVTHTVFDLTTPMSGAPSHNNDLLST
jgi:hypothetical protein